MIQLTEKHTRKNIKSIPIAGLQEEFVMRAIHQGFDEENFQEMLDKLSSLPMANYDAFDIEKARVDKFLLQGELDQAPFIKTPETSLLWAMVLAHKAHIDEANFYSSELWNEFAGVQGVAQREKEHLSFHIASSGINRGTKVGWEKLGGNYFYDMKQNYIGLDLILTLAAGFQSARAAALHEIAHSKLTIEFSDKLNALRERIDELTEKGKTSQLTEEELQQLNSAHREWDDRFAFSDECENNVVDRWVVGRSHRMNTDYAYERNYVEATVVDGLFGERPEELEDNIQNRITNVKRAIRYSFMCNNGYFPDTEEGWLEAGIRTEWITTSDGANAFAELRELCGGENGVENLQPKASDYARGLSWLEKSVKEYSHKRNILKDEIFDKFAAHLFDQLERDSQNQENEQNQQSQQGQQKQQGQQNGKSGSENQPKQGGKPDSGKQDGGNAGEGGGRKKITVRVEGRGDVEIDDVPPENPQSIGSVKSGEIDEEQAQTLEELLESRELHKDFGEEEMPSEEKGDLKPRYIKSRRGGSTNVVTTPKLGNWADYAAAKMEFAQEIQEVKLLMDSLREKQIRFTPKKGNQFSLKPSDGRMERLDVGRHVDMIKGYFHEGYITEDAASRFREDVKKPVEAQNTLVFLPDGSGSMHLERGDDGLKPIDSAIHVGCIFNESVKSDVRKKRNTDLFVSLWGNQTPMTIVKPGDDEMLVQQRIAGIKQDNNWGTNLAPTIISAVKELSERKHSQPNLRVGHIHMVIFSDGGITDAHASQVTIEKMLDTIPYSTIDFVICEAGKTEMNGLAETLKNKYGEQRVGISHHESPETVIEGVKNIMHMRGNLMPPTPAITPARQSVHLRNAHTVMTAKS